MKKIYLFSSLLCMTLALSAQEISKLPDNANAFKQVKANAREAAFSVGQINSYSNEVVRNRDKADAPAAIGKLLRPYTLEGVYFVGSQYTENLGAVGGTGDEYLYGPALTAWPWTAGFFGFGEGGLDALESQNFDLVDQSMERDDEALPEISEGVFGSTFFGAYPYYVRARASFSTGEVIEGSRLDFILASQTIFATPISNQRTMISANSYGVDNTFNWGYFLDDGSIEDLNGWAEVFSAPLTSLYLFGANIIWTSGGSQVQGLENVSLEIWTINEEGALDECLVTATNPKVNGNYQAGDMGELYFEFLGGSELLPVVTPVTIPAGQEFAVIVKDAVKTGINPMWNFSAPFGYVMDGEMTTLLGGGGAYIYTTEGTLRDVFGHSEPGFDLAIGVDGYMPGMMFVCDYADIPVEGGYASAYYEGGEVATQDVIQFASSYNVMNGSVEQITFDYPDWLTLNIDTTEFATTGNFVIQFEAEKLPDGMTNRHGEVAATCFGYTIYMPIGQGPDWIGVETTVAEAEVSANVVAGDFVLTYGEGVDKVDVYNVAGSLVASYALPANGSFTVPASDLAKGLYVLNFTGEKKATVKVVK